MDRLKKQARRFLTKKIMMFDLDGTITKSKSNMDREMSSLVVRLLKKKIVAVIGGGNYPQFKKQFLAYLRCEKLFLRDLYVLPVSGGSMYAYRKNGWKLMYQNEFTQAEKKKIYADLSKLP